MYLTRNNELLRLYYEIKFGLYVVNFVPSYFWLYKYF